MADFYATVSGAGLHDGSSWANAFDKDEVQTYLNASAAAGDNFYFAEGTYSYFALSGTDKSGTSTAPISFIGVKTGTTNEPPLPSDWAYGTARPLISLSSSQYYRLGFNYGTCKNIRFEGDRTSHIAYANSYLIVYNCDFTNINSASSNARCLAIYGYGLDLHVASCTFNSYNGWALAGGSRTMVTTCVFNLNTNGSGAYGDSGLEVFNCIFNKGIGGIGFNGSGNSAINCNFYSLTNGIYINTQSLMMIFNNDFSSCTNAIIANKSGVIDKSIYFDYNNFYNNTNDMTWDNGSSEDNSAKGPHTTSNDPGYVNAASGDFTLSSTSLLIDAGLGMRLGTGA